MKKKKIVVMRSYIVSLSCLYLMICSSCGNPRSGESKNEDNAAEEAGYEGHDDTGLPPREPHDLRLLLL